MTLAPLKNVATTIIEQHDGPTSSVEILQYDRLAGCDNLEVAQKLFYANQVGMHLKQVWIRLNNGAAQLETGEMQFVKGNVTVETSVGGLGGLAQKLINSNLTNQTTFRPHYHGTGEVYGEPSFKHFIILTLNNEEAVIEQGMFYGCEGSVTVGVTTLKSISSMLFGGDEFFQISVKGTGWVVLQVPVPANEIIRYDLNNEKIMVDGSLALLRKGNIEYKVEKSNKSLLGSMIGGEGLLLQTFTGTGEVWLAPTKPFYDRLRIESTQSVIKSAAVTEPPQV